MVFADSLIIFVVIYLNRWNAASSSLAFDTKHVKHRIRISNAQVVLYT